MVTGRPLFPGANAGDQLLRIFKYPIYIYIYIYILLFFVDTLDSYPTVRADKVSSSGMANHNFIYFLYYFKNP